MGHEDDSSTCIGEMLDGWDRALNAAVIGDVAVIVDNQDFTAVLEALAEHDGKLPGSLRKSLAQKAYARTAAYDAAISNWFADQLDTSTEPDYRRFSAFGMILRIVPAVPLCPYLPNDLSPRDNLSASLLKSPFSRPIS